MDLRTALMDWRDEVATRRYGMATTTTYGVVLIMANETIDRIVDCAHVNKIKTAEDLKNETLWKKSDQYFVCLGRGSIQPGRAARSAGAHCPPCDATSWARRLRGVCERRSTAPSRVE